MTSSAIILSYGLESSGLIYNVYADKLLKLNLVDSEVSAHHHPVSLHTLTFTQTLEAQMDVYQTANCEP